MSIKFKDYCVADNEPVCFVGEVGAFFNKDIDLACEYLDMALEAGVDVFKTEILHSPDVVLSSSGGIVKYNTSRGVVEEDYRAFIERKTVSLSQYEILFDHGLKSGARIMATVFDNDGIDFLKNNGAVGIKISRNNIHHEPLIRYAAKSGLPIVFDLGDVPLWKAQRAQKWVHEEDGNVMFNHHPVNNPASPSDHNLSLIVKLKEIFKTPIGLSCHYDGDEILYAAIGAGVNLIEKGIDVDPDREEADLVSAASFNDLEKIVRKCKVCSEAIGEPQMNVKEERLDGVRTGLAAKTNLNAGDTLAVGNVIYSWPPKGISPEHWEIVSGRRLQRQVKKGHPITWDDVL